MINFPANVGVRIFHKSGYYLWRIYDTTDDEWNSELSQDILPEWDKYYKELSEINVRIHR